MGSHKKPLSVYLVNIFQRLMFSAWISRASLAAVLVSALFLIISQHQATRAFYDQQSFHYPSILHFASGGSITDYGSNSSPGFYLLFAQIVKLTGDSLLILQLVNFGISISLLVYLYRLRKIVCKNWALLMLPFFSSIYLYLGMIWLIPDNLSWLLVAIVVFKGFDYFTETVPIKGHSLLGFGLLLACSILVRQNNIWLCSALGLVILKLLIERFNQKSVGNLQSTNAKAPWAALIISTLIPASVLLYLIITWKGLVPPSFQSMYSKRMISLSAPAFFFTVFGAYATFFLPLVFGHCRKKCFGSPSFWYVTLICAGAVAAYSLIVDTDYNYSAGRYSGLWIIAKILPDIGEHSIFIILGSAWGVWLFIMFVWSLPNNARWYLIILTAAFVCCVLIPNLVIFERYIAGFVYLFLYLALTALSKKHLQWSSFAQASLICFSLINLTIVIRSIVS